jgi:hypothetical protein
MALLLQLFATSTVPHFICFTMPILWLVLLGEQSDSRQTARHYIMMMIFHQEERLFPCYTYILKGVQKL